MNLVLQTLELGGRALVCVNLVDEAARKGIEVDAAALSARLGMPAVCVSARTRAGRESLLAAIPEMLVSPAAESYAIPYPAPVEAAVTALLPAAEKLCAGRLCPRWLCLRLLENDDTLNRRIDAFLGGGLFGSALPTGGGAGTPCGAGDRRRAAEGYARLGNNGGGRERVRRLCAARRGLYRTRPAR